MSAKKNIEDFVVSRTNRAVDEAKERQENRENLEASQAIAYQILERLSELNETQIYLAEKMGVSPQQVSKWVSGRANFKLYTLVKLEQVLGIKILRDSDFSD